MAALARGLHGTLGTEANGAAELLELAVYACVGSRDARHRQRHGADAPHVVAWVVEVKQPLGQVQLAAACGFEQHKGSREVQAQRYVLLQFILATVLVHVRSLHGVERQLELFAREQPLVEAVPRLGLAGDQGAQACVAELEDKGLVRFARRAEGRLEALAIEGRVLLLQIQVQLIARCFIARKVLDLRGVLDSALRVC
jgi:hypothetical protein